MERRDREVAMAHGPPEGRPPDPVLRSAREYAAGEGERFRRRGP
ncbi:hypothetical protein B005_3061 [Nocardiopsis alba ATCC BAA-2165]|uniref:Uncharacterized protein n=1 Tax=Nocardiopsis alba (strain ATCC BAA-2165 / BE74) TaxID=1205910 RepID=J7L663_NOCAA|nr:hypothetical protein B005_3061 [Nocardiopsis alba ATCC BAA-2165]